MDVAAMSGNGNTREERGKAIAENGNVKKVNDHSFKVKSQSGKGVYEVKATPNGMTAPARILSIAAESASTYRQRDITLKSRRTPRKA